ncbi:hypothetical protein DFH06DRAFT_1422735 [Mycena polygramma]|nr:hypothetical protein DFH06DRAFT_1422735 [Mycena polygramma]
MRFAPTLVLFSSLVPLVTAHGSPHSTSPSRSLARLQYSERRDLIDICINVPDLVLDLLGLLGIQAKLCLCIKDLDIFLDANANVDLGNGVLANVTALLNGKGYHTQCDKLPPHASRDCTTSDPCGFKCDPGFKKQGNGCVCNTGCGASDVARSMKSRRSTFTSYQEAKAYCGSLAVCGIPASSSTAWECLDVTKMNNDIHSCGGCPAPPFPQQKSSVPLGIDCGGISYALPGHVTCESGKCVVGKCETGYVAAGDKCVRAQGKKTGRGLLDGLLGSLQPATNGVSAPSGAGGSSNGARCVDVCIGHVVDPLRLCISLLDLGTTLHSLQPLVDSLGLGCVASPPHSDTHTRASATATHSSAAGGSSHGGSSHTTSTAPTSPTPSSGGGGSSGDDSCLDVCIDGILHPLQLCLSLLGLGQTIHGLQPLVDGLGLGCGASSPTSGTNPPVSAPTHSTPVTSAHSSSVSGSSHGGSSLTTPAHSSSAGGSSHGGSLSTPTHSSSASASSHGGSSLTTPIASTTPTHSSSAGGSSISTPTPSSGAGGPSHGRSCIDVCIPDIAHVRVCGPVLGLEPTLYNILQPLVTGLGLDTCGPGGSSSDDSCNSDTTLTACLKGVVEPVQVCVLSLKLGQALQPTLDKLGLGHCSGAAGAHPTTPALPAPTDAAAAPLLDLNLNLRRTFRKRHGHFARTDVSSRVLDPALVTPIVSLAVMSRVAQGEDQQSVCAALWGSLTAFLGSTQTVFVLNVKVAVAATKMCQSLIASTDVRLGQLVAQILAQLLVVQGSKSPTVPQSTPCRPADVPLPVCALGYYISPWMVCSIGTQALPEDAMIEALTLKPVTCLPSPPISLEVPSLPAKATAPSDPTDNVIFHAGALLTGCVKLNMWAGNMNYKQSHAVLEMNAVVNVVLSTMVGETMLEKGRDGRLGGAVWSGLNGDKEVLSTDEVKALVARTLETVKAARKDPKCGCSGTADELSAQVQQLVPLYTDFMSAVKKCGCGGADLANLVSARLPERGVELFERLNEL